VVLGTGINLVFPSENIELFERIGRERRDYHAIPLQSSGDKQTFLFRNRIVAGMTLGTLVVEANLTSGALITANFATDYGRQVFAVPGQINSPRSKGCHDLIKKGAKLCEKRRRYSERIRITSFLLPIAANSERNRRPARIGAFYQRATSLRLSHHEELNIDEVIRRPACPVPPSRLPCSASR